MPQNTPAPVRHILRALLAVILAWRDCKAAYGISTMLLEKGEKRDKALAPVFHAHDVLTDAINE